MARRKNNRKWIVGGIILVVLFVIVVLLCVLLNNGKDMNDGNDESEQGNTEVVDEKESEKEEDETEEEYSERLAEEKRIKQYEGEDPNKAEELSGAITYAGVNNGVLMIGTNIDQFLSSGNCELNLVRDGDVLYSEASKIIAEVSTSTCDGFNVSVSDLGGGATDIIIKLSSGGKTGTIHGEVNI